ncbi:MAG TPA: GNAT family N-acetyltransferase [Nitrososphaera sp.]|nr:GNAT family N-acetyltransferase [Nitrososphaera sp.]
MWTERIKSRCADVLLNNKLEGDYFFNRASVCDCPDPVKAAGQIAKIFWEKGLDCYLYDRDDKLAGKGFAQIDTMHVLVASSTSPNSGTKVVQIDRALLPLWIDVFCRSFGASEWKGEVERIMNSSFDGLELLLSYHDEVPAGCAALYTKKSVTGLYCLSTVSKLRRRGLANDMLAATLRLSNNLFLQTFGSEGLLPFYEKAGFTLAYTKNIYVLRDATKLKSLKNYAVK